MLRKIKIGFLVVVVFLIGTTMDVAPNVFNISVEALPSGDGVKVEWSEIPPYSSGCWGKSEEWLYAVFVDGVLVADSLEEPAYDLYTYGQEIEVFGFCSVGETDGIQISVAPIAVTELVACELNGEGASGIGFRVNAEAIATYSMASDINKENIDCYFTDYTTGWMGRFHLANPSELANDKGNLWLDTHGWRTTLISGALGDFDTITVVPPVGGNYNSTAPVAVNQPYAVLTQDNYYGLIQIEGIDETLGEIDIKATFQPIKGLRWM